MRVARSSRDGHVIMEGRCVPRPCNDRPTRILVRTLNVMGLGFCLGRRPQIEPSEETFGRYEAVGLVT